MLLWQAAAPNIGTAGENSRANRLTLTFRALYTYGVQYIREQELYAITLSIICYTYVPV